MGILTVLILRYITFFFFFLHIVSYFRNGTAHFGMLFFHVSKGLLELEICHKLTWSGGGERETLCRPISNSLRHLPYVTSAASTSGRMELKNTLFFAEYCLSFSK